MKVAVINFSGNVGKSTVARHLLVPRISGAKLIVVESINAGDGRASALRADQFAVLQEYMQTVDNVVVDIGASNVEELMGLMRKYKGSQEEFDFFVVPTVSALKQQQDTIATLAELADIGVTSSRLKITFNMVRHERQIAQSFETLLQFIAEHPIAQADLNCWIGSNEIYERVKGTNLDLATLSRDETDYKALITTTGVTAERIAFARKLATRRLASGVVPELDACFEALRLHPDDPRPNASIGSAP